MFFAFIHRSALFGFIFPFLAYCVTYVYFKKIFWKAFVISICIAFGFVVISSFLLINAPFGITVLKMIYGG